MQPSFFVCFAECVEANLDLLVLEVFQQQQGIVEENLLGFCHAHAVFFVLAGIAIIPLEPCDFA